MKKIWIIAAIFIIILAIAGIGLWYMSTQVENLIIYNDTSLHGMASGHEYAYVHVKNGGANILQIYQIEIFNVTATFTEDIVIPPGVECVIKFYVDGGPVTIETVSLGPEGTAASGGGMAVTNSPNNPAPCQSSTWFSAYIYSRSGKTYEMDHIYAINN